MLNVFYKQKDEGEGMFLPRTISNVLFIKLYGTFEKQLEVGLSSHAHYSLIIINWIEYITNIYSVGVGLWVL